MLYVLVWFHTVLLDPFACRVLGIGCFVHHHYQEINPVPIIKCCLAFLVVHPTVVHVHVVDGVHPGFRHYHIRKSTRQLKVAEGYGVE